MGMKQAIVFGVVVLAAVVVAVLVTLVVTGRSGGDEQCDPSYPTVCIPSPPPDVDCGDITFRHFEVKPPDPHRFDGNRDGVGCQS